MNKNIKPPLFDIFDKVTYAFYNPDKPKKEKPPVKIKGKKGKNKKFELVITSTTGSYSYENNDSITSSIIERKTIMVKGYNVRDEEPYEYTEHHYKILGLSTFIGESCLKPYVKLKR